MPQLSELGPPSALAGEHHDATNLSDVPGHFSAAEFFAGIGLVRIGLEAAGISVAWSNDFEPRKISMYKRRFGASQTTHVLVEGDVANVVGADIPLVDIAWASSPCTDLSMAGGRLGLDGSKSAAFWHFTRVIEQMKTRPEMLVLENVDGLATSHGGNDMRAAIRAFNELGYSVDLLSLDARRFTPQSRPRIFLVACKTPLQGARHDGEPSVLRPAWTGKFFDDPQLRMHQFPLPSPPENLTDGLKGEVQVLPGSDSRWWPDTRVELFEASLSEVQRLRISHLKKSRRLSYRSAYRRMRNGVPAWEVREDGLAGCLRTIRGGSSRQALVVIGNGKLRVRWMTPREYARLMGAPDYPLSGLGISQALTGFGDAVSVPVVSWLAANYFRPHLLRVSAALAELNVERGTEGAEQTSAA